MPAPFTIMRSYAPRFAVSEAASDSYTVKRASEAKQGSDLRVIDPDPVHPVLDMQAALRRQNPVTTIRSTKRTTAIGRTSRDSIEKDFFTSQRAMVAMSLPALMDYPPGSLFNGKNL